MIYNEYAQVLEATEPDDRRALQARGPEHHQLERLPRRDAPGRDLRPQGVARRRHGNRDIAVRFVRASLKGWIYCRDQPDDCVQYTTDAGSQLGAGHQAWMMNEVNALVWPSPLGVGVLDPVFCGQTVRQVAKNAGIIKTDPSTERVRRDRSRQEALAVHQADADTKGADFKKGTGSRSRPAATEPLSSTRRSRAWAGPRTGRPVV